ncbi:MAG: hypothetical protein IKE55_07590 [Kiritimatiellae bacterium]|nr:hypothetical protein [Kiritimatiellia bacterium]
MTLFNVIAVVSALAGSEAVWPEGLSQEMNTHVAFRSDFEAEEGGVSLDLAAWYSYRVVLNGEFVAHGPARGPEGVFRVDRLSLPARTGVNRLQIEVAGYNCRSFYQIKQAPFLMAEVHSRDGRLLAATGRDFKAFLLPRVQKVPRYSYQRTFSEAYVVPGAERGPLKLEPLPRPALAERGAGYPLYEFRERMPPLSFASVREDMSRPVPEVRYVNLPSENAWVDGFDLTNLAVNSFATACRLVHSGRRPATAEERASPSFALAAGQSAVFDNGLNDSGFFGFKVTVEEPGRLFVTFDEVLTDGEVAGVGRCSHTCNAVAWDFEERGAYRVETFEPYTLRYLEAAVLSGRMKLSAPTFRSYKNAAAGQASFKSHDPVLDGVFAAGVESFRQNAVDVLTDCPSRERAGWNCDSYFTAAAATLLTGTPGCERLYLENYAIPGRYERFSLGVLPSCYPADSECCFIPNWSMWFALQLEEYFGRSGDRAMVDRLRTHVLHAIEEFRRFRNSEGLLENMPGAFYVGYGRSNDLRQDVNYPTCMLWAAAMDACARLYGRADLAAEARLVRQEVARQSWTGKWFCDNAVRQPDGALRLSGECTETCQYYAFFFNVATPATHPALWRTLLDDFGPKRFSAGRKSPVSHPEIWASDLFVGDFLRLKLLERAGLAEKMLVESKAYFSYMADQTGTLWELAVPEWSCCHGFCSYVTRTILRGAAGLRDVNHANKAVAFAPEAQLRLPCEVSLPLDGGTLQVSCTREGGSIRRTVSLPAGWRSFEEQGTQECPQWAKGDSR